MVSFVKAHGLGNDFVILASDNLLLTPLLVKKIADRKRGVGCDQVISFSQLDQSTYKVFFFNADGSEAEACGNGTRALGLLLLKEAPFPSEFITFKVKNNILKVRKVAPDQIEVEMATPKFHWVDIPQTSESLMDLPIQEGQISPYYTVNVGNPHLISFVENVTHIDIQKIGPVLENHFLFPNRINVTFAEVLDAHSLKIIVWERGSGLTEACGTAACASAALAIKEELVTGPVLVSQKGGDLLIDWTGGPLKMIGTAAFSYRGELDLTSV